ncbi:hypothetical protein ACFLTA_09965 [Bacteroidota bacterium]
MVLIDELSEGERFLHYFFKEVGIKAESQVKLENLKGDNKSYRVADFYLPRYKVYVEFFGNWNTSPEYKEKYRDKINIYLSNNIPCVYLYPENLGTIEYTFDYRFEKELRKHNLDKELFKYRTKLLWDERMSAFFYLLLAITVIILFLFDTDAELFWPAVFVMSGIAVFQIIRIIIGYFKFFGE